jgi:anti-sigma B factor antagonist
MLYNLKDAENHAVVIECPSRVAIESSIELKDILNKLMEQKKYKIIINLSNTKYMDSSGLGAVVSRIAIARSNRGDVCIASVPNNIRDLLELTHLNQILNCFENVELAVASFK